MHQQIFSPTVPEVNISFNQSLKNLWEDKIEEFLQQQGKMARERVNKRSSKNACLSICITTINKNFIKNQLPDRRPSTEVQIFPLNLIPDPKQHHNPLPTA